MSHDHESGAGRTGAPQDLEPVGGLSKRALDLCLAALLIVLLLPLISMLSLILFCLDRKSVLSRTTRLGFGGRRFDLLTFRTALIGSVAEEPEQPGSRPRLGRLLARSGADRLPQLWNVLRGELSFVGPAPQAPDDAFVRAPLRARPGVIALTCDEGDYRAHWTISGDLRRVWQALVSQRGQLLY